MDASSALPRVVDTDSAIQATFTLEPYLHRFSERVESEIARLRISIRGFGDPEFVNLIAPLPEANVIDFHLNVSRSSGELIEDAVENAFVGMMRGLVDYIDTLIGVRELSQTKLVVNLPEYTEEALREYLESALQESIQKVATDQSRKNPAKFESIGPVPAFLRKAVLGYFDIRAALEHHKSIAKRPMDFCTATTTISVDGEVKNTVEPLIVEGGRTIEAGIVRVERCRHIEKGQGVRLTYKDVEDVAWTLITQVAPILINTMCGFTPDWISPKGDFVIVDDDGEVERVTLTGGPNSEVDGRS